MLCGAMFMFIYTEYHAIYSVGGIATSPEARDIFFWTQNKICLILLNKILHSSIFFFFLFFGLVWFGL